LIAGVFSNPQLKHRIFSDEPHSPQNFIPLVFSKPQAGQRIEIEAASTVEQLPTGIQGTGWHTSTITAPERTRLPSGEAPECAVTFHRSNSPTAEAAVVAYRLMGHGSTWYLGVRIAPGHGSRWRCLP
jgi:hypothetical protein